MIRQAVHIFRKDVRRLWWIAGITLVLLGTLAWQDRWRSDYIPGPIEGWFNLLVPFAWSILIALAIEEEPLVGDRQFWITRPYRRPALLVAKAIFVLVFVHGAMFVADCYILGSRGFNPFEYLPALLRKQLTVALVVSLPATALAAVVRNLAHFLLAAVLIAAAAIYVEGAFSPMAAPFLPVDYVRLAITLLVITAAGAIIISIQYARRRTWMARIIGIVLAVVAAVLYATVTRGFDARVEAALSPAPQTGITLRTQARLASEGYPRGAKQVDLVIPIAVSNLPEGVYAILEQLKLEIVLPDGGRYEAQTLSRYTRVLQPESTNATLLSGRGFGAWQSLGVGRSIYERAKSMPVRIRGEAAAALYREAVAGAVAIGERQFVRGLGICSGSVVEDRFSDGRLKVECESPREMTALTPVELVRPDGRTWKLQLGNSGSAIQYPTNTWLSPLNRRQTSFQITNDAEVADRPGEIWQVARRDLPSIRIVFHPQKPLGSTIVNYEFDNLKLENFERRLPTFRLTRQSR